MALPVCVLATVLLQARRYGWALTLLMLYLGICLPLPSPEKVAGALALLQVARLPLLLAFLSGNYLLLWHDPVRKELSSGVGTYVWAAAMTALDGRQRLFDLSSRRFRAIGVRLSIAVTRPGISKCAATCCGPGSSLCRVHLRRLPPGQRGSERFGNYRLRQASRLISHFPIPDIIVGRRASWLNVS